MEKNIIDLLSKEIFKKHSLKKQSLIPVAGKVFDQEEIKLLLESVEDFWLTAGRFAQQFESEFSQFMQQKYCLLTNSGSSANLLAISPLTSPKLGDRRLKAGDEVITVAAGFPTTVNPIVQNQMIPVFVDVDLETYNINIEEMKKALSPKTRAIMIAHTLGNPFNLKEVTKFAKENNINYICTAHHLDDCVESYFMNFLKGHPEYAPIQYFCKYPEATVFRPFLLNKKSEFISFAKKSECIEFSTEDELNSDLSLMRNWTRQCILPVIEKKYKGLHKVVFKKMKKHLDEIVKSK
jgi:hypothetical protein